MTRQRGAAGRGPTAMLERWQQVYQTGEAALHPFTRAELFEGEWWQRAVPVTVDGLGRRVAGLLQLPGGVAGHYH